MMVVAGRWCDGFARWQWWLVFFLGGGWVFKKIYIYIFLFFFILW